MKRCLPHLVLLGLIALAAGCQTNSSQTSTQTPAETKPAMVMDPVARGAYLVKIMGCNDCHTAMKGVGPDGVPMLDSTMFLAGHPASQKLPAPPPPGPWFVSGTMTAWSGPWGISYTANITPDTLTGIGIWTEDIFTRAMRTGRHAGVARPILPPMPWFGVAALTDEDMHALYSYLRTIPAVHNEVPQPVMAGPPPAAGGTTH